jgi:hypothetical protein
MFVYYSFHRETPSEEARLLPIAVGLRFQTLLLIAGVRAFSQRWVEPSLLHESADASLPATALPPRVVGSRTDSSASEFMTNSNSHVAHTQWRCA